MPFIAGADPCSNAGMDLVLAQLERAFKQLGTLIARRVQELESGGAPQPIDRLVPELDGRFLGALLDLESLSAEETVVLLAALAPELSPHVFDESIAAALQNPADHPRIGGVRGRDSRTFLPTGETALFLCGARTVAERFRIAKLFSEEHAFARRRVLHLEPPPKGELFLAGRVVLTEEALDRVTHDKRRRPRMGPEFPAERLETTLDWEDLVLDEATLQNVRELEAWIRHGRTLLDDWGLGRRMRPGYRALFFGPPRTGKTLTASLLGKQTGRDVYRIDLALVVSKFIGETEKNLARVFARAEDKDWLLFFDEADALFGKRTQVRDAHDRYANQEVAYLLQRVESFSGLVILASNFRSNIDDAFLRRFQSVIHFPKPSIEERQRLWAKLLPAKAALADDVNLKLLCHRHELTGANIANVVQYACLQALTRGESTLRLADIQVGIDREYQKEGKVA